MKVLIVDDLVHVHKYLDKMIHWNEIGISHVYHAYNGQEAIALLGQVEVSILITDIKMPLVDGIGVINYINENDLDIKIIVLSAYNEFDYVREAMKYGAKDYLLKPVNHKKLITFINKLMNEIRESQKAVLKQVVPQIILSNDKTNNNKVLLHAFQLLGIAYYFGAILAYEDNDIDIENTNIICCDIAPSKKFIVFLCNEKKKIDEILLDVCNNDFVIGISTKKEIHENIFESYEEANHALSMRFYEKSSIYYYKSAQFQYDIDEDKLNNHVKQLLDCLHYNYKKETIAKEIDMLFLHFINKKIYPKIVENNCYKILIIMNEYYQQKTSRIKNHIESNLNNTLVVADIHKLKENFKKEVNSLVDRNVANKDKTDEQTLEDMINYIKNNCHKNLSLDRLSAEFYINKYKISREFKRIKGINLKDYILKVRMNKAVDLLKNTQLKIYEITQLIGYSSEAHFSSAFKKYWGVTPKEIRIDLKKVLD